MDTEHKKQKMQDILRDTVNYYREDPVNRRCVDDDGNCMYTWGDNHCAVGRYLKPEYQRENWPDNNMSAYELAEYSDDYSIDEFLVDKAHGLDVQFWRDLQDIHDTVGYWEEWNKDIDGLREHKLTDRGKEIYVAMQDKISRGEVYDD